MDSSASLSFGPQLQQYCLVLQHVVSLLSVLTAVLAVAVPAVLAAAVPVAVAVVSVVVVAVASVAVAVAG